MTKISFPPGREPAIAGLGITELGKVYGRTAHQFAAEAVNLAVADAGLTLPDVDGLIVSTGLAGEVGLDLAVTLGLNDLGVLTQMQGYGSTAGQMVQYASMAIMSGLADTIAIVWADAPLTESGASAYKSLANATPAGWRALTATTGAIGPNQLYALGARRHMDTYGTTSEQFGAIAVAQRAWAGLNPLALFRDPITLADHQASRMIADPLHLLDCCMVTNGGIAVVLTTADRARDLAHSPIRVLGWGQGHPGRSEERNPDFGLVTGAKASGEKALAMAGITLADIDLVELYDCYTYTVLVSLEDYGFCAKGEGGAFVAEPGVLGPDGKLKLNTGGGQLSGYYMWGMTPLSEAILQTRGTAGERQVDAYDHVLVSGNGGILDYHSTLILGSQATL